MFNDDVIYLELDVCISNRAMKNKLPCLYRKRVRFSLHNESVSPVLGQSAECEPESTPQPKVR